MRTKLAAVWISLQVIFFIGWAMVEEARLSEGAGRSILVRTAPVDPRDLLSGQYMELSYEFSRRGDAAAPEGMPREGETLWVLLKPDGGFHTPMLFLKNRPRELEPGMVALRGRAGSWRHEFGVERYYVREGTPTPATDRITVRLRVGDDGRARIEQVLLDGKPWP